MQFVSRALERSQIVAQGARNGFFQGSFERLLAFLQERFASFRL
jgi:hypothetical protein